MNAFCAEKMLDFYSFISLIRPSIRLPGAGMSGGKSRAHLPLSPCRNCLLFRLQSMETVRFRFDGNCYWFAFRRYHQCVRCYVDTFYWKWSRYLSDFGVRLIRALLSRLGDSLALGSDCRAGMCVRPSISLHVATAESVVHARCTKLFSRINNYALVDSFISNFKSDNNYTNVPNEFRYLFLRSIALVPFRQTQFSTEPRLQMHSFSSRWIIWYF